jgi:L-iditol 2-dehydrogenase
VVRQPLILGHEASGTVVACGQAATDHVPGQRVAIEPGTPCRRCRECKAGRYNLCADVAFLATPPVDGAFAQFLAVDADFAHPVPDELSDDAAALLEPLSVAIWACGKGGIGLGQNVLVTGGGPIGVLCALVACSAGASVTVVEIDPARRERGRRLGLKDIVSPDEAHSARGDYEVVLECSGADGVLADVARLAAPAAHLVAVGMSPSDDLSLPLSLLQTRELNVTGTFRYANTYPRAIALASSNAVPLDALVDAHFALEETDEALSASATNHSILKAVIHPNLSAPPAGAVSKEV